MSNQSNLYECKGTVSGAIWRTTDAEPIAAPTDPSQIEVVRSTAASSQPSQPEVGK